MGDSAPDSWKKIRKPSRRGQKRRRNLRRKRGGATRLREGELVNIPSERYSRLEGDPNNRGSKERNDLPIYGEPDHSRYGLEVGPRLDLKKRRNADLGGGGGVERKCSGREKRKVDKNRPSRMQHTVAEDQKPDPSRC